MLLHLVHRADAAERCLRYALDDAVVLLVGNGVWAALPPAAERLTACGCACFALREDLAARGLEGAQAAGIALADDARMVELAAEASAVMSWL